MTDEHNETPCISVSSLIPFGDICPNSIQCVSLTDWHCIQLAVGLDYAPNCSGLNKNKSDDMCNCT